MLSFRGWQPGRNTQGRGWLAVSLGTVGTGRLKCFTWSLHLPFFAVSLPPPDPAIQGVVSLGRGEGAGGLSGALAALMACAARNCFGPEGHCWAAGPQADSFLSQETACQHPAYPTASPAPDACTVLAWLAPTAQNKPPFSCCFRILLPITDTCIAMANQHLMQATVVM